MEVLVDEDDDVRRDIAHSTFTGMLHDKERNRKYYEALQQTITDLRCEGKEYIHVLDIGAGTGILSMMAAKAGADFVTACELFQPMSMTAEKIVEQNMLSNYVHVINKSSTELHLTEDMPQKADVVVTEIFDTELIGEGVLPTLRDAHARLLDSRCRVIPDSADINIQLIESDKLWGMNKLTQQFNLKLPTIFHECSGIAAAHEIQINQLYPENLKLLSDPTKLLCFDFQKPFHHTNGRYSSNTSSVVVTSSGVVHGVLFWWDLVLHKKKKIVLSMEPKWVSNENKKYTWRDHWMQAVYYLKKPLVVNSEAVYVSMFHDDYSIWFDVSKMNITKFVDRPLCSCALHITWPRERFAMFNDSSIHQSFQRLLEQCVGKYKSIAMIGDVSLLPFYLNKDHYSHLQYIECSLFSQNIIQGISALNKLNDKLSISRVTDESLLPPHDIIIAEPYLSSSLLPWHHLQIWSTLEKIRNFSPKSVKCFPTKASLKGCIVCLDELWKVRAPVKTVEGFDLSKFDSLIEAALSPLKITDHGYFHFAEPYSMWEFQNKLLTEVVTLKEFDLKKSPCKSMLTFDGEMDVTKSGVGHAVVMWIDFELHDGIRWTTGLTDDRLWVHYSRQGLFFLENPEYLQYDMKLKFRILFLPDNCEVMFSLL